MRRHALVVAGLVAMCGLSLQAFTFIGAPLPGAAQDSSYQGLIFAVPSGWTNSTKDGRVQLTPSATQDVGLVVVIFGVEKLNGKSLDDWFRAKLAADLASGFTVLQSAQPTRGRSGAVETMSGGRTVQDSSGGVRLQIYHSISDGQQAGIVMTAATSEAAMKTHMAAVQSVMQSLRLAAGPTPGANPPAANAPARGTAAGQKSQLSTADLFGSWTHSTSSYADYVSRSSGASAGSSTIAYVEGYEFAADGSYTHVFTGMVNSRYVKETDAGTWGFQGGNLVIRSKQRDSTKTYQIVSYQTAPDGTVFMTLLAGDYPRTEGNIGLYGQKYVRKAR